MKTLSLDLRERILASYDAGKGTRQEVADRYDVSLGMVKKLLFRRKQAGEIGSWYTHCGRKPYFTEDLREQIKELIRKQKDITLEEIRETLKLNCSLPAIHYVLRDLNLTFKKNAARQRARARRRGKSHASHVCRRSESGNDQSGRV
jgi:transposase